VAAQGIEKVQRVDDVVLIVFRRVLYRFTDQRKCREVQDRLGTALDQDMIDPVALRQVAHEQPVRGHGSAMAGREIVEDPDIVAVGKQQLDGMAADIARTAGNEDSHGRSLFAACGLASPC
jgi:hypothetical protein